MLMAKPKAVQDYMNRVAELGCWICSRPANLHHITTGVGMSQRASDYDVIPLCPDHHQHGGYGVAIHAGKKEWERRYGSELEILKKVRALCE